MLLPIGKERSWAEAESQTGSYISQASILILCLHLLSVGITSVHHHA